MIPTYPDFKVYDFRACPDCGGGLLVEVRGNIAGEIWSSTHCFQCGKDTSTRIRRTAP